MKITRQDESELVVVDSCLWLAGLLMAIALVLCYVAWSHAEHRLFTAAGVTFAFGIPWLRKSTFTFDAEHRIANYRVLRYFKTTTGSIPFADIRGVETESISASNRGTIYRLTLITPQERVPLSDAYSGGEKYHEKLRQKIQKFVMGDIQTAAAKEAAMTAPGAREASVRSLIAQGRKIDAVRMLRNDEDLDLTEAKLRVDAIEKEMAAKNAASQS